MRSKVWTGHELSVHIFKIDPVTQLPIGMTNHYMFNPQTDTPLLSYCYWQSASITPSSDLKRRPSTDRSLLEIIADQYIYTCRVSSMYSMQEEFCAINLFNRVNRFVIVFYQFSFNTRQRVTEQNILYNSCAQTGEITFQENNVVEIGNLIFAAEDFYQVAY